MSTRNKAHNRYRAARALPFLLIVLSLACSLPAIGKPTPTQLATLTPTMPPIPTPTPQPLPPNLVESDPPQSVEVPLEGPITLYFNQPMDRGSVEAALTSQLQQEITFTWIDDTTVVLYLSAPLEPESELTFGLDSGVRSAQGMGMKQPINLNYQTASYLRLTQILPEEDASEIDPSSAILAAFNRPVVPLGADQATLPPAFTLDPAGQGRGEWINTSTYVFYPDPSLEGGKLHTVNVNPDLKSTDGGPLREAGSWGFTTASPQLLSLEPETEIPWPLDAEVVLTFNQPMDPASVEANFSLAGLGGSPVPGESTWDEDTTTLTFTPDNLLARDTIYNLSLNGQAQARGGTPLGDSLEVSVATVPPLSVYRTEPPQGEPLAPSGNLALYFSAPIQSKDPLKYITMEPSVPNLSHWWDEAEQALHLFGNFKPSTSYVLTLSASLPDAWGTPLGQEYQFVFTTAPLRPEITLTMSTESLFLTPQDPSLIVQVANLSTIPLTVGSVTLDDFIKMLGPEGYEFKQGYQSTDQISWEQTLDIEPDRTQPVELFLSRDQSPLGPGLYFMRFNLSDPNAYAGPYLFVVSNVHVTFKIGTTDALVWAVDLSNDAPLVNAPVTIYDSSGAELASGQTDVAGIFRAEIPPLENLYSQTYAVVGQPGEDSFGMALSTWSQGVQPWEFGIPSYPQPSALKVYLYTDRAVYRPGQTVYFRAVVRHFHNGRYTLPDMASLPVTITDVEGQELASYELPLSTYGTAHGEYKLDSNAKPSYYSIQSTAATDYSSLGFQVANYRKPEINLQVNFASEQVQAGQELNARVDASYFFGAPAGNLPIRWALYKTKSHFHLPGYQVGPVDTGFLEAFRMPSYLDPLGEPVSEGDGETAPDGTLALQFPTELEDTRLRYTLEVTVVDESGLPVSARDRVEVNPDEFYIGVRPDTWIGRAGEPSGFEVLAVDWEREPAGARDLRAEFQKVVWVREDPPPDEPYKAPEFTPQYSPLGSTDFTTDEAGQARLAFTPPEPGTYQLDVYNPAVIRGEGTRTQLLLWVGGEGQAIWPNQPNSRLHLTPDKESYQPGDTAQVFIPNPFGRDILALATLERESVIEYQVLTLRGGGHNLSIPLSGEQAPNVYLSVTLLGRDAQGGPDFRKGYLNLSIEPVEQTLQVSLTSLPERTGPGDEVTLDLLVSDSDGNPVQGEFSLAVVDLAALALADPNAPDIVTAFYSERPNGVFTGLTLAAYARRQAFMLGGLGGGGDEEVTSVVRERFPDTAYWNAEIVTDVQGKTQINVTLPDTLTTWQVDARGLTVDTRVGQAQDQIVTTKTLLVRPATPRFLVVNDHAQLAAVVQNNSQEDMLAEVSLQANGFLLDDPSTEAQEVSVPAGGRARVEWWGVAQDVSSADLVFSVVGEDTSGNSYQDAARPALGALPVGRFIAPQAFRTAGTLDEGGEILELVSLPRSFDPEGGELEVELSPSLAAAMMKALDVLERHPYASTEQILSGFLPNLETYRTLQEFGLEASSLEARLDRTLNEGLQRLVSRQNPDGGWGWWQGDESDLYITTYVLFGLTRAREAGININLEVIRQTIDFLKANRDTPQAPDYSTLESWELDRLAFESFVLSSAGEDTTVEAKVLYQVRDQFSPWAQALLALTLERLAPGSPEARTILPELEASANRSATGAHWEFSQDEAGFAASLRNMHTTLSNSAIVVYALAQRDPGSPLVADAVRHLMANHAGDGAWGSTYTTAWTLISLNEVIRGTGELGGNFTFAASVNGNLIADGKAGGTEQLTPVTTQMPAGRLYTDYPNALVIQRDSGQGRLYYAATLNVGRPVDDVAPLAQGLNIERAYFPGGQDCSRGGCDPIDSASLGERVSVHLTLNLPQDAYFLAVEDYVPAGSEILDVRLQTSQLGESGEPEAETLYDPRRPFAAGWGWWLFNPAHIYDNHIAWTADYLPAGAYELTYTLVLLQPGEYRTLPAHAWQLYFPEVQANSAGDVFEIKP